MPLQDLKRPAQVCAPERISDLNLCHDLDAHRRINIDCAIHGTNRHNEGIAYSAVKSVVRRILFPPPTNWIHSDRGPLREIGSCSAPIVRMNRTDVSQALPKTQLSGPTSSSSSGTAALLMRARKASSVSSGRFTLKRRLCDAWRWRRSHPRSPGFGSTKYDNVNAAQPRFRQAVQVQPAATGSHGRSGDGS